MRWFANATTLDTIIFIVGDVEYNMYGKSVEETISSINGR